MSPAVTISVDEIKTVLERYPRGDAGSLVHLLQDIQGEFNYLPPEGIREVADYLDVPLTKAYSVASFYKAFSLKPRGRTIIKVCMGTTCHIRGGPIVIEDMRQGLGIGPGETTDDMEYTSEVVNCVGACALAPVVIAGDKYLANVKPGSIMKRLGEGEKK